MSASHTGKDKIYDNDFSPALCEAGSEELIAVFAFVHVNCGLFACGVLFEHLVLGMTVRRSSRIWIILPLRGEHFPLA